MKVRNDFVSNSSSCSFVIEIKKDFLLDDFVAEACNGCLKHADEQDSKEFVKKQDAYNNIILKYHLNASELLYLGSLCVGTIQTIITKDDEFFHHLKKSISKKEIPREERIVENTNERIVVETDESINGMAIPTHKVEYVTMEFHWENDYSCNIEKQKKVAKEILRFAKNYGSNTDYKCRCDSNTYCISRNTIWNTRALIAAGHKIELEDWMDLDKIEKMIVDGNKVVCIRVNNGGDGVDEDSIYSFGGWSGEDVFDNMDGIEIIYSETM